MRDIGVGVIGTGFMGKVHAEQVRRLGNVEIAAVVGSRPERAKAFAEVNGIPIAAERTTVATEISRLFVNASRLDGVAKKWRYVSSDKDPPGKKLGPAPIVYGMVLANLEFA